MTSSMMIIGMIAFFVYQKRGGLRMGEVTGQRWRIFLQNNIFSAGCTCPNMGRTNFGEVEPWSTGGLKQQQVPNLERLCFLLNMYDYVICLYVNVTMCIFVLIPVKLVGTTKESNQWKHGLNLQQWVQNSHQRSNLWRQFGASQKWSSHNIP